MARQPSVPKQQQSRNQAPPVGETGMGTNPSMQDDAAGDKRGDFTPPNTRSQGTQTHPDMYTKTNPGDERGGEVTDDTDQDIADLEAARLNAPDGDDDMDPDADRGDVVETETQERKNPDDDILVRMLHEDGVHHVNLHPLEPGTVISMKRGEFEGHQDRGMLAEEVGDDYDGEVYDVSEPWKPEEVEAE